MPVQARTQEEAVAKAKEAYSAQPKASAKTGRSFFERLKPEKVRRTHDFFIAQPLTGHLITQIFRMRQRLDSSQWRQETL